MKYVFGLMFLLIFTSPVFAQQLVPQDDSKDPCRRFKMRVLTPPDFDRAMVTKTSPSIDPKMVLNPCPTATVRLPIIIPDSNPNQKNNFVIIEPGAVREKLKLRPIQPPPFLNTVPKQPQP